ncbi:uncharacterized protein B0H18DRAFT_1017963 [Fomitopsis serialis]|uniref:uncharacterized protein n=1 Tax=Fomitopsis serialis TaxID=139415 RepID=UPI0020085BD8|nr:uncharacterized protein B0H18DRAFT_1017963 [Neoantrodia serialis]KAH9922518.1 hypothetical protein B0H18DRAFT_1017963 [Neoantrodia serialis]
MMIFDCCHRAPRQVRPQHINLPNSSSKEPPPKSVRVRATDHDDSVVPLQSVAPEKHHRTPVRHKIDGPDVTSWSACADDETTPEGNSGGMFLKVCAARSLGSPVIDVFRNDQAFYRALRRHKDATRGELLNDIAEIVKTKVDKHNQSLSRIHGRNCIASDCRGGCSTDDLSIGLPTPEVSECLYVSFSNRTDLDGLAGVNYVFGRYVRGTCPRRGLSRLSYATQSAMLAQSEGWHSRLQAPQ